MNLLVKILVILAAALQLVLEYGTFLCPQPGSGIPILIAMQRSW